MKRCWHYLDATSRSFAAVIHELDGDLSRVVRPPPSRLDVPDKLELTSPSLPRSQVALFYLILRGLDTIEDDMTIPIEKKAPLLEEFYKHLEEDGWNFHECASPAPSCSPDAVLSRLGRLDLRSLADFLLALRAHSGPEREGPGAAARVRGRRHRVQAP